MFASLNAPDSRVTEQDEIYEGVKRNMGYATVRKFNVMFIVRLDLCKH